jgi:pimeloyl-ACP methyl ester carboxylesterase
MRHTLIVHGSAAAFVILTGNAWSQLPVDGAPLAQPGRYEVMSEAAFGSPRHVVFRPADLNAFPQDDTLPVVVWGNGGCSTDSRPYAGFLTTIASHGFLVLALAPGEDVDRISIGELGLASYDQFTSPFLAAFDWAEAESARENSPLKGRVATDRMAALGLSACGSLAVILGADPRIDTIGVFNGDAWGSPHLNEPKGAHVERLHGPVLLVYGTESPMMPRSAEGFEAIGNVPVFYGARRNAGHMLAMDHPGGGEFSNVASNWLKWILKDDAEAGAMFAGERCGLCTNPNWQVRSKRIE